MAVIPDESILSLDVGGKRIGVAVASSAARLPRPLITLINDDSFMMRLKELIEETKAASLVVGYPRNLSGDVTGQTRSVESFVDELKKQIDMPIYFQDEALTSAKAESELKERGKPFEKGAIDALAATYILEDYLAGQKEKV